MLLAFYGLDLTPTPPQTQKRRPKGRRFRIDHRREIRLSFLLGLAVTYSPTP